MRPWTKPFTSRLLEDFIHGFLDLARFAVAGAGRAEFLLPLAQLLFGAPEPPVTDGEVQFRLARAVKPPQVIAFGGHFRRVADRELVEDLALLVGLVPEVLPDDLTLAYPLAEGVVLAAGAGQDAYEAAVLLGDVVHVLDRGQLAVGDVEKVLAAGQLAKQVPGVAVRGVVGHIAAGRAEMHRHAAVASDGEDVQELF